MHESPEAPRVPCAIRFAGVHTAEAGQNFPPHRHDTWEMIYLRTGHIHCQQGADLYPMHHGTAILHPPHCPHADYATTGYTTYYLWLDAPPDMPWPRVIFADTEGRDMEQLCRAIVHEWSSRVQDRARVLSLLAGQVEVLLRRAQADRGVHPTEQQVARAERIMEERHGSSLTVAEVAGELGLSRSSLQAHFARWRDYAPKEYLQQVRLRHALALLHNSTLILEDIADACGFNSGSHLSRRVRAATGKSPGQLRHGGSLLMDNLVDKGTEFGP